MKFTQQWTARRYEPDGALFPAFPAAVPGNLQYDWAQANGLTNLQYGTNVRQLEATETWHWMYDTVLDFAAGPGESVWFAAEGIDYQYEILLDGAAVAAGEGMFTPVEIDLTGRAQPGSRLSVHIFPHPNRGGEYSNYRQAADQCCKPPVTYGWDWNPRLLISGLWRPAYVETRGAGYIRRCEPRYTLNDARDTAELRFDTECSTPVTYTLTDPDGVEIYRGTEPRCTVHPVRLWWCRGQGAADCYRWRAESADCVREGLVGFRTVRLVRNADANENDGFPKSRYAAPITVELNGRRIFAKGSNFVNPELFFGRITAERYAELIEAAADAHMNIFRMWGGSGIQHPVFYEQCDRAGIMVWQEFMLSCNNYRDNDHYLAVLNREARSIVRQLRPHPSLILWCGGNELFDSWSGMDDQSRALRLLNKICYEEDCDRPFLPTSPLTGMSHGGYLFRHDDGRDSFRLYQEADSTAYTEFGIPGISPVPSLEQIIPADERFPIRETEAWTIHHGYHAWSSNPCRWLCLDTLAYYFGESDSLAQTVERSGILQRAGYQAVFEEARRQWPHCAAAINWCFDEPWITAANNALLAYPCIRKPGYFGAQDAMRPVLASARIPQFDWAPGAAFTAELWLLNDSGDVVHDTITVTAEIDGQVYALGTWATGETAPRTNTRGPRVTMVLPHRPGLWTLRLRTGHAERDSAYTLLIRAEG